MKEDKKQCCCSAKKEDNEIAMGSCCSVPQNKKDDQIAMGSCCSGSKKHEEVGTDSCCSVKQNKKDVEIGMGSCCSVPQKIKDEELGVSSCCSVPQNKKDVEIGMGSCCSVPQKIKDEELGVSSCCSVPQNKKDDEIGMGSCCAAPQNDYEVGGMGSCCSIPQKIKDDELGMSSCCAVPKKENEGEICSCCAVPQKKKKGNKELAFLIISILSVVASYLFSHFDVYGKIGSHVFGVLDPAWIAIVISGTPLFKAAFYYIKRGRITSSLLVTIAMLASITIGFIVIFGKGESGAGHGHGFFFAAGEVAVIMAIGQFLENLTIKKSRAAINSLIAMKPTKARRRNLQGEFEDVNINDIEKSDVVLIKPNEIISVDGVIISGETSIDTSAITGEHLPKDSQIGDEVFAGTQNLWGAVEVVVTKPSKESTLTRLIEYIGQAEKNKAPVVRLADKWASYLVVGSLLISIIVLFVSIFGLKLGGMESVQRAATILVVFCPCALALATPVAIAAGIGNASKKGLLVKSGLALEKIAKIDKIAFDKTGTLTEGKIRVDSIYPYNITESELIQLAASVEQKSEHPIARAIIEYYKLRKESNDSIQDIIESSRTDSILGIGVEAIISDKKVGVYKIDYSKDIIPKDEYNRIEKEGKTIVSVVVNDEYVGAITLSDTLRPDITSTIKELSDLGIESVMLTGDNETSAKEIASKIGINRVSYDLLPEDKVTEIEKLKKEGSKVLMVGDGVNDAAALVAADASIAIAAMGSSVAMETAEVSLMSDNIKKIPFLVKLSKRTLTTIKINITLSLLISFTSIILSALGLINIVAGALIHNGSSVLVTLHAALLLLYKEKKHNLSKASHQKE